MHHLANDNTLNAAVRATEALARIGLEASPAHIAVVDASGCVMLVNAAWQAFARDNVAAGENLLSVGRNYLDICRKAATDPDAAAAYAGIASVLDGSLPQFSMTYSCRSPTSERWFRMNVAPLDAQSNGGAIIAHTSVIEQKSEAMVLQELKAKIRASFAGIMEIEARRALEAPQHDSRFDGMAVEAAIQAHYLAFDMSDLARDNGLGISESTRILAELLTEWARRTGDKPFDRQPE